MVGLNKTEDKSISILNSLTFKEIKKDLMLLTK